MSEITRIKPETEKEAAEYIKEAAAQKYKLKIEGGGTKKGFGSLTEGAIRISTKKIRDISFYSPSEMIISAKAGTPLIEIEEALAEKNQRFSFEPVDFRNLYGTQGEPTIGSVVAGNISGSRRFFGGACRDHLIGVKFINGLGEEIHSGGRVMKNVTGLDLSKMQAGAWGKLGLITEVTFKLIPKAEKNATFCIFGLSEIDASSATFLSVSSPFEVTGAAHIPAMHNLPSRTFLRLDGVEYSVVYRFEKLRKLLKNFGELSHMYSIEDIDIWHKLSDGTAFTAPQHSAIWRLCVKPSMAVSCISEIKEKYDISYYYDWSFGLIWLAIEENDDACANFIRKYAKNANGYATLFRSSENIRKTISSLMPEDPIIAAISARIKAACDPEGIFQ